MASMEELEIHRRETQAAELREYLEEGLHMVEKEQEEEEHEQQQKEQGQEQEEDELELHEEQRFRERRELSHRRCSDVSKLNMVKLLVSGTQGLFTRVSSFFPIIRSFSRNSSDSGFQSGGASLPPSRPLSRRSSFFSLLSANCSEAASEDEEEFFSHVKVVPGGNITDDYTLLELLGEGAFSKVYLGESKTEKGGLAAVKVISKEELCKEEDKMFLIEKEIEIMSQLDHPNIVKLYEVYVNAEEVCLVMELAKGGEVFDKLIECGCLSEQEAARHLHQVLEAVNYLHTRGIVHRDLKPENILYYDNKSNSKIMVTDFGLSEYEEELSPESPVCGTATYLSPEVITRTSSTRSQDMWSLGVIAYIVLCGYPPFFRDTNDIKETELLRQISRGKYKFHNNFWDDISIEAKDFVKRLMCVDPDRRMTVEEALDHTWIRSATRQTLSETIFSSILQAIVILGVAAFVLHIYFSILSSYFNIDYITSAQLRQYILDLWSSGFEEVKTHVFHLTELAGQIDLTQWTGQLNLGSALAAVKEHVVNMDLLTVPLVGEELSWLARKLMQWLK